MKQRLDVLVVERGFAPPIEKSCTGEPGDSMAYAVRIELAAGIGGSTATRNESIAQ